MCPAVGEGDSRVGRAGGRRFAGRWRGLSEYLGVRSTFGSCQGEESPFIFLVFQGPIGDLARGGEGVSQKQTLR